MSLRSMTGYGRGAATGAGVKIEVELTSVNRKQLDVHILVPKALSMLEARMLELVQKRLSRGRITGEVNVSWAGRGRAQAVRVDEDLAAVYLSALRKTAKRLKLQDDFGGSLLLDLPNVVRFDVLNGDAAKLWPVVRQSLQRALTALLEMKRSEGEVLAADIADRFDDVAARLERIRRRAPYVVKAYRRTLQKRLATAGLDVDMKDERLLREMALFADRSDIAEEITRLTSHLAQAGKMLHRKPPTGKSLDFLLQEMFREINTIGAKAHDAAILKQVVECKAELERIREQVQNVE